MTFGYSKSHYMSGIRHQCSSSWHCFCHIARLQILYLHFQWHCIHLYFLNNYSYYSLFLSNLSYIVLLFGKICSRYFFDRYFRGTGEKTHISAFASWKRKKMFFDQNQTDVDIHVILSLTIYEWVNNERRCGYDIVTYNL